MKVLLSCSVLPKPKVATLGYRKVTCLAKMSLVLKKASMKVFLSWSVHLSEVHWVSPKGLKMD